MPRRTRWPSCWRSAPTCGQAQQAALAGQPGAARQLRTATTHLRAAIGRLRQRAETLLVPEWACGQRRHLGSAGRHPPGGRHRGCGDPGGPGPRTAPEGPGSGGLRPGPRPGAGGADHDRRRRISGSCRAGRPGSCAARAAADGGPAGVARTRQAAEQAQAALDQAQAASRRQAALAARQRAEERSATARELAEQAVAAATAAEAAHAAASDAPQVRPQ
jgi:hypothetical protein